MAQFVLQAEVERTGAAVPLPDLEVVEMALSAEVGEQWRDAGLEGRTLTRQSVDRVRESSSLQEAMDVLVDVLPGVAAVIAGGFGGAVRWLAGSQI